ncbi:MAG: DUF4347 domain-containing protein, partial [Magnetococcales bacterium]|nr:DUF4347 domain-containing protein [Magnetococcales bacterium]
MNLWSRITHFFSNLFFRTGNAPNPGKIHPKPAQAWRSKLALRLEKRLMFDASGVLTALAALHHDPHGGDGGHDGGHDGDHASFPPPVPDAATPSPREMIFIDPTVENYQTLIKDIPQDAQVVILDPHKDGVEQISAALKGHSGVDAVHIVSHGSAGYLALGGSELDVVNLEDHTQALQDWGAALSEKADIMIYGCDIGAGLTGGAFVSRLAELTGADVAASNNLTGAADKGGDWILEVHHGAIDTNTFLSTTARLEYHDILPSADPIISNLHGDTVAYAEGNGSVVIDQGGNVVVTDGDSVNFDGGALTVAIGVNRDPTEDFLSIRNQGSGAGQIGIAGANVTYQGTVIGTFSGGSGTNDLVVSFNANADPTAVSALLKNITYTNSDTNNPTASTRSIAFSMTDGSGGTSSTSTASVVVTGVNDAPTIIAGSTLNYTENNPATVIDNTITIADVDDTNLEGATISISSNYQAGADILTFTNTASITGSWSAGTLTLTGTDSKANYQTALRSVKYQNTGDAPTTTARTISFQVNDGTTLSTAATATVNVTSVNDAPMLTGTEWYLPEVLPTDSANTGMVLSTLLSSGITDADASPLGGVAIIFKSNTGLGKWQYRIDGGAWANIPGGLNVNNAFLLKSSDEIRFQPDGTTGSGQPYLTFYAWDRTSANVAGDKVDASARGGVTEFSTASGTIKATINLAPILDNSGTVNMITITEDTISAGQTVSALVGPIITDTRYMNETLVDAIAIQSLTTDNGSWQFSINGGTSWTDVGVVSADQSLLLRQTDLIRFLPDGFNPPNDAAPGSVNFTFVAWDQTGQSATWAAGSKVSTVTRGNATPFSSNVETVSISITNVNDAPVLTVVNPVLPDIMHTDTANPGVLVSTLVGTSISDVDAVTTPLEGIAIYTVNSGTGGGFWEFSTDNGTTWTSTGTVSSLQALLLRPQDKIRFQPNVLNSSDSASFNFYAWDQTQNLGGQGTKTDVTTRGGTTAFSSTGDMATIRINVAPTLDATATPAFPTITEDNTANVGVTVSTLLGGNSDIDVGASKGIAVYGRVSGNGTWQYNTGSGWNAVGAVSGTSALLLRDTDQIRFVPNAIKATSGSISFYAWDQTSGTFGTKVNVSTRGGTTAFSSTGDSAGIIVTEINDAPTLSAGATTLTFVEGNAPTAVNNVLSLTDIDDVNLAGATVQITGNYLASEDILAFTNQSGITGSWNGISGTMTLS